MNFIGGKWRVFRLKMRSLRVIKYRLFSIPSDMLIIVNWGCDGMPVFNWKKNLTFLINCCYQRSLHSTRRVQLPTATDRRIVLREQEIARLLEANCLPDRQTDGQ